MESEAVVVASEDEVVPEGEVVVPEDVVVPDEGVVVLEVVAVAVSDDDVVLEGAMDDETVDEDVLDAVVEPAVDVDVLATADEFMTCNVVVSELFSKTASREVVAVATTLYDPG